MSMKRQMEVMSKVRQDAEDLSGFMRDLESWHHKVRKEDEALRKSTRTQVRPRSAAGAASGGGKHTVRALDSAALASTTATAAKHTHQNYSKWDSFDPETAEAQSREVFNTSASGTPAASGQLTPASIAYVSPETASGKTPASDSIARATLRAGSSNPVADRAEIERERGNESFRKGQFDSALRAYSRAIGMNPGDFRSLSNRSMAHLKMKNTQAAEDDATAAIAIDPTHVKSLYRRGVARVALGRLRDAVLDFQEALRLDPGNKAARAELSKCLEQRRTAVRRAPKQVLHGATVALDLYAAAIADVAPQDKSPEPRASGGVTASSEGAGGETEKQVEAQTGPKLTAAGPDAAEGPTDAADAQRGPPATRGSAPTPQEASHATSAPESTSRSTEAASSPAAERARAPARSPAPASPGKVGLPGSSTQFETLWRSMAPGSDGASAPSGKSASSGAGEGGSAGASEGVATSSDGQRQALLLRLGPRKFARLFGAVAPEASLLASVAASAFDAMLVLLQASGPTKATARMSQWLGVLASVPSRSTVAMMLSEGNKGSMKASMERALAAVAAASEGGDALEKLRRGCEAFVQVLGLD